MLWVADPEIGHNGFYYTEFAPSICGYCGADFTKYETRTGGYDTYYGTASIILTAHCCAVHGMMFDFVDYDSFSNEIWDAAQNY